MATRAPYPPSPPHETRIRITALLCAGLAVAATSTRARAESKEVTLAVAPAYAIAYVDARNPSGVGGGVDLGFGISEAFALHASGFASWHPVDATKMNGGGTIGAFAAMVGLSYTIDVIRVVPTFDVSVGVVGVRGDAAFRSNKNSDQVVAPSTALGLGLGFGIDYLLTRRVAVGLVARYHSSLTDLNRVPVYIYAGPRVVIHFGG